MRRILTLVATLALVLAPGGGAHALQDAPRDAGVVSLRFFACGGGIPPREVARASCSPTDRIPDLQVFVIGSGANQRGIGDAALADGAFSWSGLPDGEYVLNARSLPDGFDRFYVAGLAGVNSPPGDGYTAGPNEGYLLPLEEASGRHWDINVYLIRDEVSVDLGFRFWQCPPAVAAAPDMAGLGCRAAAAPDGFAVELYPLDLLTGGPATDEAVTLDDADRADPARAVVRGLTPGPWVLRGFAPDSVFGFAMRTAEPRIGISLNEDRSGYTLALPPQPAGVATIDVYLLAPPA
ncbi:MAG: hypothetical protein ACKOWF_03155 [Chloroflexota bacterium]